ncbi:metallophosphoesterase [candidate division CSSED10-310 bacterium]|uniref:Metallophosphoesterase n=1 Tax=candidate division CSSED10-310 bacterium TaxID=2855610 RepID=A0ABV6Z2Q9_UNCC1
MKPHTTVKIIACSDIHGFKQGFHYVQPELDKADFIVVAGDLTTIGDETEAQSIIESIGVDKTKILAVFGNMDTTEINTYLERQEITLHNCGKIRGNIGFFGLGGSNKTPMRTPQEFTENEIISFLNSGYRAVEKARVKILVSHTPPYGVRDRALFFLHAGSKNLRSFIIDQQPDLCLCGHIHEAKGIEKLGQTVIINTGRFSSGTYAQIDIHGDAEGPYSLAAQLVKSKKNQKTIISSLEQKIGT